MRQGRERAGELELKYVETRSAVGRLFRFWCEDWTGLAGSTGGCFLTLSCPAGLDNLCPMRYVERAGNEYFYASPCSWKHADNVSSCYNSRCCSPACVKHTNTSSSDTSAYQQDMCKDRKTIGHNSFGALGSIGWDRVYVFDLQSFSFLEVLRTRDTTTGELYIGNTLCQEDELYVKVFGRRTSSYTLSAETLSCNVWVGKAVSYTRWILTTGRGF